MPGTVERIAISPIESKLPQPVASIEVLAGQGPRGDRNFVAEPEVRNGHDLTLIEAEALEAFTDDTGIALSHDESRRNVLTRRVRLNELVGKRFRVGEVECVGVELCEPCTHLQKLTRPGVLRGLVHRGGLRANVTGSGTIAVGDELAEVETRVAVPSQ
jgi:MOSC domain-containing protein YiiM